MMALDRQAAWRIERAWAQGHAQRLVWWIALACAVVLAAGAWLALNDRNRQAAHVAHQLALARAAAPPARVPDEAVATDFAVRLGSGTSVVNIIEELRRSCERSGVVLTGVQVRERAPSHEQLGRAELTLTLRGPYTDTKQVLKDATDRFTKLTVQRLRMRRLQSPSDVETTVTLSLWSAPVVEPTRATTLVAAP